VAYLAFKADLALVEQALVELALAVVGVAAAAVDAFFAVVAYGDLAFHLDFQAFVTVASFHDACLDHYDGIVLALFGFGNGLVLDLCFVVYHAR